MGVVHAIAGYAGGRGGAPPADLEVGDNTDNTDNTTLQDLGERLPSLLPSPSPPPCYEDLQDFTEAIYVEFDPTQITFEQLVTEWTRLHQPTETQSQLQRYRSVVWYLNETQQMTAERVVDAWKVSLSSRRTSPTTTTPTLYTAVLPATTFYAAEEYHQDYYLLSGQARFIQ